jgi:hypothetical protein
MKGVTSDIEKKGRKKSVHVDLTCHTLQNM